MRIRGHFLPIALVLLALALPVRADDDAPPESRKQEGSPAVVERGRTVSIEYTLKLDDGSTADSNVGEDPLVFQQGQHQILPALEVQLEGLEADQRKQVTLSAEDGYGPVNPDAFQRVPRERIPEEAHQVGAQLVAQSSSGAQQIVRVHEVDDDEVVLDMNHPLAGETLHFDIKILSIE